MKRILVFTAVSLISIITIPSANAQFIRDNAFHLPMVAGEVAFMQNDTATALYAEDFYPIAKAWIEQNYPTAKINKEKQDDSQLQAQIQFKIDDQHIQAPLYYQGTLTVKWKDQVIQVKLDKLAYTPGQPKGKSRKNTGTQEVSFQVRQQVRSGADKLYPHTWDSLNEYGAAMLKDFSDYIQKSAKDIL